MTQETKRPRLHTTEITTILASLRYYEAFLDKHLRGLQEDDSRFAPHNQDKWLRAKERLNWMRMTTITTRARLERQIQDTKLGRPKDLGFYGLTELLNLKGSEAPGEYIRCLEALKHLPYDKADPPAPLHVVYGMVRRGLIAGYHDPDEDGLLMVRRLDIMRLAAYIEAIAPKHRNNTPR